MYKRFFVVVALVVRFYCAVFGVLQEAVCCLFPSRLCKQACCRARNKPTPPKRRLPKTECVKHAFSHCWDRILTFPPQPLPLARPKGLPLSAPARHSEQVPSALAYSQPWQRAGLGRRTSLLQGGANEPLCVIYSLSVN